MWKLTEGYGILNPSYDPSSSLGGIFMDIRHPPYILRKFFLSVIKESENVFANLTNFSDFL
jgi:hypothetical protein